MPPIVKRWFVLPQVFMAIGCSNQFSFTNTVVTEVVQLKDFVLTEATPVDAVESTTETISQAVIEDGTDEVVIESPAVRVVDDVDVLMPKSVGIPVTVESLVGQVNGRPIYANAVLEPIGDQLQAAADGMSRSEFSDKLRTTLYSQRENMGTTVREGRIYDLVIDDLLITEARSSMTEEQAYGLFRVLDQMRKNLVSVEGGSQTVAKQNLEERVGITVEKFLESQRDQIMIDALYRQEIWPRVNVTWRDIQREYEQVQIGDTVVAVEIDQERVNAVVAALRMGTSLGNIPKARGSVTLGMIRIPKDDLKIDIVVESFKKGMSFSQVATLVDIPDGGVWETFEMGVGGTNDIDVAAVIKNQISGVVVGEHIPPFELGANMVWMSIVNVEQPISIYNRQIQIALHNALRWIQFNREKNRFVDSLWGEGSLDEVKAMADRVANIAARRYQQ